jgi:hypothetical protein
VVATERAGNAYWAAYNNLEVIWLCRDFNRIWRLACDIISPRIVAPVLAIRNITGKKGNGHEENRAEEEVPCR